MRSGVATLLARPAAKADWRRFRLVAVSTAGAGAFMLAGARVVRLRGELDSDVFAPFIAESGLRPGTITTAALLTVPIFVLTIQALRVGSVARDRRMAALRLAGATPRDVRTVAAVEAGGAALAGGVLALWAYLLLWIVAGALPPEGLRLLPAPDVVDIAVWAVMTVLLAAAGAAAGALLQRRVVSEPLGVFRRAHRPSAGRGGVVALGVGLALVAFSFWQALFEALGDVGIFAVIAGMLLAGIGGGPVLVRWSGRRLKGRGGAEELLAGYRLEADPRSPGRVAGVLIVCGVALGVETALFVDLAVEGTSDAFYVAGIGLAVLVTLVACAIAVVTLVVGAVDQLLDARRAIAALSALGVDEESLSRVFSRQFAAAAIPAVVLGVLIGGLLPTLLGGLTGELETALLYVIPELATAGLAALAVAWLSRGVARLLRPQIREGLDPENLRVA